jgi:hypothetical protein
MTGKTSVSLGHDTYRDALDAAGISIGGTYLDEGENCYDSARRVIGCVPNALKMRRLDHVEEETSAIVAVLSRLANDKVIATGTIHKKTETPYR